MQKACFYFVLSLSIFWLSCNLNEAGKKAQNKNVELATPILDSLLLDFSKLQIELLDSSGHSLSQIYNDSLKSLSALEGLSLAENKAQAVRLQVKGYVDSQLCYSIVYQYDNINIVKADTIVYPGKNLQVTLVGDSVNQLSQEFNLQVIAKQKPGLITLVQLDRNGDGTWEEEITSKRKDSLITWNAKPFRFDDIGRYSTKVRIWAGKRIFKLVQMKINVLADTLLPSEKPFLLSQLNLFPGILTPSFAPEVFAYQMRVPFTQADFHFAAKPSDSSISFILNGQSLNINQDTLLPLIVGSNAFSLVLKKGNVGSAYTFKIIRDKSADNTLTNLNVSTGNLSTPFVSEIMHYKYIIPPFDSNFYITPVAHDSDAVIKINGLTLFKGAKSIDFKPMRGKSDTLYVQVIAPNGSATGYDIEYTQELLLSSKLLSLAVSAGTLSPVFDSSTYSYACAVNFADSTLQVTPKAIDTLNILTINNDTVISGQSAKLFPLKIGENYLRIEILTRQGAKRTYSLFVKRNNQAALASLLPSVGNLSPSFDKDTLNYTANVANNVGFIRFTPKALTNGSTIRINTQIIASDTPSDNFPLDYGLNTFTFNVTTLDSLQKTYTVKVNRQISRNNNLSALTVAEGFISPVFAAIDTEYTISLPYPVSTTTINAGVADVKGKLTINGVSIASGAPAPVSLAIGANIIPIEVMAQDSSKKTYRITLTRAAPSTNTKLASLAFSAAGLSPAFNADSLAYTLTVPIDSASIQLIPTVQDSTATLKINTVTSVSGSSNIFALHVGENSIVASITAQDGSVRSYKMNVFRQASPSPRYAYLWSNDSTSASYVANNGWVYNPTGNIEVTHTGQGTYLVKFTGLGGGSFNGGNVQVAAYGGNSTYCTVGNWNASGADFIATTNCYNITGSPVNSQFSMLVNWPRNANTGGNAFALVDDTSAVSIPNTTFAFNSGNASDTAKYFNSGAYANTVKFMNLNLSSIGGNILVNAVGSNNHCSVYTWNGTDFTTYVNCVTPAGAAINTPYQVLVNLPKASSAGHSGYAWLNNAAPALATPYTPSATWSYNSGGGAITVTRTGIGVYNTVFAGLGNKGSTGGNAQVSAYQFDGICKLTSWYGGGTDYSVSTRCFDKTGVPADAKQNIWVTW